MNDRERFIEEILKIELAMFLTINSHKPSSRQEYPEYFKLHRCAQFAPWSAEALASYLNDLQEAQRAGQNLMRLKYARIQGLIDNKIDDPNIDEMIRLTMEWQKEVFRKYPGVMRGGQQLTEEAEAAEMASFKTYARSELGTYSLRTLRLLHSDMILMQNQGGSWSEAIYESLVKGSGYPSLAEAERSLRRAWRILGGRRGRIV